MLEVNRVQCIDALSGLRALPEASVDCVVTSPPYWSLRDYGLKTTCIWGGNPDCDHDFTQDISLTYGESKRRWDLNDQVTTHPEDNDVSKSSRPKRNPIRGEPRSPSPGTAPQSH